MLINNANPTYTQIKDSTTLIKDSQQPSDTSAKQALTFASQASAIQEFTQQKSSLSTAIENLLNNLQSLLGLQSGGQKSTQSEQYQIDPTLIASNMTAPTTPKGNLTISPLVNNEQHNVTERVDNPRSGYLLEEEPDRLIKT